MARVTKHLMGAAMVIAMVMLVLSPAPSQAVITATWTDCGGSIKIQNITLSPEAPVPGEKITFTTQGVATTGFSEMNMELAIADRFIHRFDGCKGATIDAPFHLATIVFPAAHCPVAAGPFTSLRYVTLSPRLRLYPSKSRLTGTDASGNMIVCVDLTLNNSE